MITPSQAAGTAPEPPGSADAWAPVDVVALGESMVTFLPSRPGRLADVPSFTRAIGGAESNVACALAQLGHRVRWVSRVGADGFGEHLVDSVARHGVDTRAVQRDPARPTGVYFRTAGERAVSREGARGDSEVVYYRAGSAASAMSPALVPRAPLGAARILHLTGITAALSADCLALLRDLTAPAPGRPLVSFDVNYRVSLWPGPETAGAELLALARGCDLVFVGEDEARAAWGVTGGPAAVRARLPEPAVLVVKRGARGATVFERGAGGSGGGDGGGDRVTAVPALRVDVVAPVGAGDAFAAGYLSGTLRGLGTRERARHGHLLAAAVLTAPGDLGTLPRRADADRLAALGDTAWGRLRLGPGWVDAPPVPGPGGDGRPRASDAGGAARGPSAGHEGEVPAP